MGTEELKLTRYTGFEKGKEYLKDFQCSNVGCGLFIDDKDIEEHNYQFEVSDYANDITKEISLSGMGYVYGADFWLKHVNHLEGECPESERCQECCSRFRTKEMKYIDYDKATNKGDEYYCLDCFKQLVISKAIVYNQERNEYYVSEQQ